MAIFERVVKFDFSNVEFSRENFINDCAKGFVAKVCLKEFPNNDQRKLLFACPYFSIFGVRLHAEKDIESSKKQKLDLMKYMKYSKKT